MSLKTKIEAVIFAAEEPVTLAQLAAVFAPEILASQSLAQGAPAAEGASANAEDASEGQDAAPAEAGVSTLLQAAPETDTDAVVDAQEGTDAANAATNAPSAGPTPDAGAEQATLPLAGPSLEDVRLARQRDKQVRAAVEQVVRELIAEYAGDDRGIEVREIAGGYRMATKAEYHDAVRAFVKRLKPPMKLSLQALETLAVVAYKQPITAPEISEIRGVDSGGVMGGLISRKLITTAGRKQVVGRPILYKTTREFLLRFGLKNISELPSIEEFEKMAAEMADADSEGPPLQEDTDKATASTVDGPAPGENAEENVTVDVANKNTEEAADERPPGNAEEDGMENVTVDVTGPRETEGLA
ncbi:MAG: SMC-Scp complex subunit ScpB [Acidobacteriaceae bacterium]